MMNICFGVVENEKEKLSGDELDSGGGVSGLGPSAALTPAIWDKTIPYDGKTFHLEYMDLEEFLMENGITASEQVQQKSLVQDDSKQLLDKASTTMLKTEPSIAAPISLLPTMELEQCDEEVITITVTSDSAQTKRGQYRAGMSKGSGHRPTELSSKFIKDWLSGYNLVYKNEVDVKLCGALLLHILKSIEVLLFQ